MFFPPVSKIILLFACPSEPQNADALGCKKWHRQTQQIAKMEVATRHISHRSLVVLLFHPTHPQVGVGRSVGDSPVSKLSSHSLAF